MWLRRKPLFEHYALYTKKSAASMCGRSHNIDKARQQQRSFTVFQAFHISISIATNLKDETRSSPTHLIFSPQEQVLTKVSVSHLSHPSFILPHGKEQTTCDLSSAEKPPSSIHSCETHIKQTDRSTKHFSHSQLPVAKQTQACKRHNIGKKNRKR